MSKKKQKTKAEKIIKKHDFSHLVKTKAAAIIVEAETKTDTKTGTKSPQNKQITRDLRVGLIVIGVFIVLLVVIWWFFGKNDVLLKFTDNIKLY